MSEAGADERIARRIEGIFAAVPALRGVRVVANQGVVTLEGKVAAPEDIARAEEIASRIQGVVTVENNVVRDLSVQESVQSIGALSGKATGLIRMLPLIGVALAVAFGIALIGYLLASLTWLWRRFAPNSFLAELIASAIRFVFVIGGIVIGLQIVGAGALLGAVLGGAGIIGIALGFAMRDTIENYVASILLSIRQPFRANDLVVIDQYEGRVIRLTSRATILMTLDGNHLRIPNSTVFKAVILNYTRNPQRRFDFELGIDADSDPTLARHIGVATLQQLDFVLDAPAPSARVEQVGDSNIVIRFLGWIDQERTDWYKARSRAIPAVKSALETAGFALPEPIYRLRFDQGAPFAAGGASAAPAARPRPEPATTGADQIADTEHVAPENEIAEMVDKERAQDGSAGEDLLSSRRPVE
ncbi:mechanosensitive ion channel family protein [Sphingomonas sp. ST-64]|uniref:Small-conductance mechanosensitive channel n=1 Tax=Sphingomonas plantiphila TaxID=3163295 RepID=A0ABW8YTE5_9SPHN